ncbi:hypothetical protein Taro_019328, partial [Colocasia esculenta]|nr:hypothetical protein [Colocasia esculenta]
LPLQLELACRQESGKTYKFSVDEDLWTIVSKHLVVWVDEQTYWIASRFLMLGFELDLYSPAEYCMVYWYMYVVFIRLLEKMQLRLVSNSVNGELFLLYTVWAEASILLPS